MANGRFAVDHRPGRRRKRTTCRRRDHRRSDDVDGCGHCARAGLLALLG
ncbi:hypothetical protein AOX55_000032 [Sinorhizobium fredii CCBAU 25509]|nr:hypothetical protein AOX55_000032 [Sinorhizobium fredii CCBAU 25509]